MKTVLETTPAENIDLVAKKLQLSMTAAFVPWSQSRNKAEKQPSLNWMVTIYRNGRPILTTDYGAGCAHCLAYKAPVKRMGGINSVMRTDAIKWECENGYAAHVMEGINHITRTGSPLQPSLRDVLYDLTLNASVLDSGHL